MEKLKKTMKQKKFWIPTAVLSLLLLIFIIWGSFYYSKFYAIERYVAAYQASGNTFENIKGYLVWSDTGEQVTSDEAKYTNFTALNHSEAKQLTKELQAANASAERFVKRVGNRWLIFTDYKIALKPLSLNIKTNVDKVDILLNGKKVSTSDSDDYNVTVDRLPVADYTASISGLYKNKKLELSKVFDGKNTILDLTVTFKSFTVTSNLLDGDLYFDDTRVATLSDGRCEVADYPLTNSAQVYVKKTYSDGDMNSNKKTLSDIADGATVELNAEGLLTEESAGKILVSAFDQLIAYLNQGQDPSGLSSVFESGSANAFYKGLKESIASKMQTDKRTATSLTIPSILLNAMTQVGKDSYVIDFSARYDFYYDKSTDIVNNTQGDIIQDLSGQLTLKKSGQNYLISQSGQKAITVVKEDNQVKAISVFPEKLLGSWSGKHDGALVSMSFKADGSVSTTIDYIDDKLTDTTHTAKVTKLEEKNNGLYRYLYDDGTDVSAFVTGGIGGVGVKYAYGVKINGDTITPVIWQTGTNQEFDYSHPLEGITLTKQ